MKVILTGSTGFIGSEVLNQALAHPSITSLICITRRALPDSVTSEPKVKVIILSDFTNYPSEVLTQLSGSEACIWALGLPAHKNPDLEESKKVEIGFTLTAAKAFTHTLAPVLKERGKTFRFVYLSGMFANRDKDKNLWFLNDVRNIKGEVENGLLRLQENEDNNLEVSIMRPGGVLAKGSPVPNVLARIALYIKVDELAGAMIREVVGNVKGTRTLENNALRKEGKQ